MMLRPKEVVCKWVDAFNGHDVDAIVSLYHDNATNHQVTNEPVIGIDAIREMFTAEFATADNRHCYGVLSVIWLGFWYF